MSRLQLYQDIVHVRIGHNAQDFGVHKGLLCEASSYFKGALSRDFQEAREMIVHLREDDVGTFERFHLWLYTGSILDSDESLESLSQRSLIDLYIWADLRGIPKLQDLVSDMLQTSLIATLQIGAKPLDSALIHLVYSHTMKSSPLRKLWTCYYTNLDSNKFKDRIMEDEAAEDLPRDFLHDMLLSLKRQIREPSPSTMIARGYFMSGCFFHVHGERALCAKKAV
ncbi:hypothetical protein MMC32_002119 [Xylographa parallela]|nr:hypothetical protein [Xylographa parallela]